MYELKKMEICKFVGNGPSSYEKRIYRAAVSHWSTKTGENQLQYYEQELLHERSGHTFTHPVLQ